MITKLSLKKTLLIGGEGFIGCHVARELLQGGSNVRILTRSNNSSSVVELGLDVEFVRGELQNEMIVKSALRGVDFVVHLVSSLWPSSTIGDGLKDLVSTLVPTVRLLELAASTNVQKVVFISSGGTVYGDAKSIPIVEDTLLAPTSIYGLSKKTIEEYLRFYAKEFQLNSTILRISNPYGPGQSAKRKQGIVAVAFDCLLNNQPFYILGDGDAVRDYIYIKDVASAIVKSLQSNCGGTFNISSGKGVSVKQMLDYIELVAGRSIQRQFVAARSSDVTTSVLSNDFARRELRWYPETNIMDGLTRTWNWVVDERSRTLQT